MEKLNDKQRASIENIKGLKVAMNNAVVEYAKGKQMTQFEVNVALVQLTHEIHIPQLEMYLESMEKKPEPIVKLIK
jgi:hypothetical protein